MSMPTTDPHACFDGERIPRLGMGGWAIGGPFTAGGAALGYGGPIDDRESTRAIHAAVERGIRYFDTAGAYGAGHGERLLGAALAGRPDVFLSTKIGLAFDEGSRTILGEEAGTGSVAGAIDAALGRLRRERIDLLFLHLNALPAERAGPLFDEMERAVAAGKLRAYGWSTDFADRVEAVAARPHFGAVQHAMNVFFSAPVILPVIERHALLSVARSPLAMGLLTGKYDADSVLPPDDVRGNDFDWNGAFRNGRVREERVGALAAIGECLRSGGRTTAQGALAWLWARSPGTVPICGFGNVEQVEQNAAALGFGALPDDVMAEIETLVDRSGEHEQRER